MSSTLRGPRRVRALLVVPIVLAVLVVAAFFADRAAEDWAERYVAEQVSEQARLAGTPGVGTPEVDVRGFPFLTQAAAGRYDDVRLSMTAEQLGQPAGTTADVRLTGVELPLSAVLSGAQEQQIPVDRIDGTATLSYELLSQQLGGDSTLSRDGDRLRVTRTIELLGDALPVTATGRVTLDGRDLVVDVEEAQGAGVELPDFLVDRAGDLLDLRYPVPELPFGLRLTGVAPATDGVVVRAEATDTVIVAPA